MVKRKISPLTRTMAADVNEAYACRESPFGARGNVGYHARRTYRSCPQHVFMILLPFRQARQQCIATEPVLLARSMGKGIIGKSLRTLASTFLACDATSRRTPLPRVSPKAFATKFPSQERTHGHVQIGHLLSVLDSWYISSSVSLCNHKRSFGHKHHPSFRSLLLGEAVP